MNDPHYEPIDSENFSAAEKIEVTFTLASADGSAPAAQETEEVVESAPETAEDTSETAPAADSSTTSTKTATLPLLHWLVLWLLLRLLLLLLRRASNWRLTEQVNFRGKLFEACLFFGCFA